MQNLIENLNEKAQNLSAREQNNIAILVDRIDWFSLMGDQEKLAECKAEAQLWLAS